MKKVTKEAGKIKMGKIVVMDHPLIQHKIGIIRREETGSKDFRTLVSEIAMLMCYEATRDLKLADVEIDTPICKTTVKELKGKKLAVVPILRAGLGMVDGMLAMIPAAKVGHIGLYRDPETLEPVEYYCKLPATVVRILPFGGAYRVEVSANNGVARTLIEVDVPREQVAVLELRPGLSVRLVARQTQLYQSETKERVA
jgi:hypothetical protein